VRRQPFLGLAVALPANYGRFATIGHLGLIYLATAVFVLDALLKGMRESETTA
jgi:hypothetical protein